MGNGLTHWRRQPISRYFGPSAEPFVGNLCGVKDDNGCVLSEQLRLTAIIDLTIMMLSPPVSSPSARFFVAYILHEAWKAYDDSYNDSAP